MTFDLKRMYPAAIAAGALMCCASITAAERAFESYPAYSGNDPQLTVDRNGTHFTLWSPEAQAAQVLLYSSARNSAPVDTLSMHRADTGTSRATDDPHLY